MHSCYIEAVEPTGVSGEGHFVVGGQGVVLDGEIGQHRGGADHPAPMGPEGGGGRGGETGYGML